METMNTYDTINCPCAKCSTRSNTGGESGTFTRRSRFGFKFGCQAWPGTKPGRQVPEAGPKTAWPGPGWPARSGVTAVWLSMWHCGRACPKTKKDSVQAGAKALNRWVRQGAPKIRATSAGLPTKNLRWIERSIIHACNQGWQSLYTIPSAATMFRVTQSCRCERLRPESLDRGALEF
jgi:hypothetical protein